jgi:uncharacterized lipoprotein YddW (UPF0748 family)
MSRPTRHHSAARAFVALALLVLFAFVAAPLGAQLASSRAGDAPPPIAREFRAAWVSPVWGSGMRDWPSKPGLSADEQRRELRALMDEAQELGLDAIVLHVRMASDAIYPTPFAPWSGLLSGESGVSPGYDALAYAVEQAHARGLQLHAWFNPYRALIAGSSIPAGPTHVTRAHPEWVRRYGTQSWLDPGEPAVRRLVLDAVLDVVRRYDVDGVHIDDYFYPYREQERVLRVTKDRRASQVRDIPFPDDETWERYGEGRFDSRADWRRANVNDFIRDMYREVKATKPWVAVGISPFGIWRSGVPAGVTGLDQYAEIYADARKWLAEGWLDYLAPQLYWELAGAQLRFRRLDAWWRTQNPHERHLWPGLHTARSATGGGRWSAGEIPAQIDFLRAERAGTGEAPGHIHFRLAAIDVAPPALRRMLRDDRYAEPAAVPSYPWLATGAPPAAPRLRALGDGRVAVEPGDTVPVGWWVVHARRDGRWSMRIHHGSARTLAFDGPRPDRVVVTPLGRAGEEGMRSALTP